MAIKNEWLPNNFRSETLNVRPFWWALIQGGGGGGATTNELPPDVWANIGGKWVLFRPGGRYVENLYLGVFSVPRDEALEDSGLKSRTYGCNLVLL